MDAIDRDDMMNPPSEGTFAHNRLLHRYDEEPRDQEREARYEEPMLRNDYQPVPLMPDALPLSSQLRMYNDRRMRDQEQRL